MLDIFQTLADIVGAIVAILQPIVTPIGDLMILWIEWALQWFPTNSWLVYIIVFSVFIIAGIIVNCIWPGDKPREQETEIDTTTITSKNEQEDFTLESSLKDQDQKNDDSLNFPD